MASVQSSLVMHPINEFGTQAQKEKYLPVLGKSFRYTMKHQINLVYIAKGDLIGAFVSSGCPDECSTTFIKVPLGSH